MDSDQLNFLNLYERHQWKETHRCVDNGGGGDGKSALHPLKSSFRTIKTTISSWGVQ